MTTAISGLAQIAISALLLLVLAKIISNFALPYGLLRAQHSRPVSFFPLIELVPLLIAIFIAWFTEISGWLSSASIVKMFGFLVLSSYLHFVFFAAVVGVVRHIRTTRERNSEKRTGETKGTNKGDSDGLKLGQ